ncbi:GerMN domain-containing protein [Treponema sp.]
MHIASLIDIISSFVDLFHLRSYHLGVAERRNNKKTTANSSGTGCLLWIAFLIILIGLFLFNRDTIAKTLRDTRFLEHIGRVDEEAKPKEENKPASDTEEPAGPSIEAPTPKVEIKPAPETKNTPEKTTPEKIPPVQDVPKKPEAGLEPKPLPETKPRVSEKPSNKPETKTPTPVEPELKQRLVYYVIVDNSGSIIRTTAKRYIPNSDSPLTDVLAALIAGPSKEEANKAYSTLIPPGTRLLSAIVRGTTAYLNFSEEFQFNSYGIEGYAAQLRQVIWTTTEFPNIKDVQILIEGRRIDYLGFEGVWIGSPLNRDSL